MTASEWFQVNASFHETLASFSWNPFLTAAVRQQNKLRRMWEGAIFRNLSVERIRNSCDEHLAVVTAVEDGNLEWRNR